MNGLLRAPVVTLLSRTPLGLWPVRVRSGVAAGARWTLYPWTSYWRGTHEPALQAQFARIGGGDMRGWACWDLGAHFGLYSIGLARRVGPTGQVAAFEPHPANFARLQRHCAMNRVPWLKCYSAAVSDHARGADLLSHGDPATTTAHLAYEGEKRTAEISARPVATVRLDDLVQRGELRAPRLVKMDVEGHGHHALAGMRETFSAARPILLAAFHSPQEIAGMMSILAPLRYSWREVGGGPESSEISVGGDYLFTP
jgi:FkbM family methyltransferase